MPPSPRNRPALKPSPSSDTRRPGGHRWRDGNREPWLFLFGGAPEDWRTVEVLAWWTDDRGREVVQIEYRAEMSTWGGSFIAEREKMRDA